MSRYDDLLAGKNQAIRALWGALGITASLALLLGVGWFNAPRHIRVYIPPDLSVGASMTLGEIKEGNIYLFALNIWRQLNRWDKNGIIDYENKIHMYRNYLTPSCYQNRLDNYASKKANNELNDRVRTMTEIPGRGFSTSRVQTLDFDHWIVSLDVQIEETLLGESVKTRYINYPIRVVRYNVDPQSNIFGLAIDCLADKPRRIKIEKEKQENNNERKETIL